MKITPSKQSNLMTMKLGISLNIIQIRAWDGKNSQRTPPSVEMHHMTSVNLK